MAVIESSVKVDRPVEQVWAFLTDLENQKKLSTYITGIEVSGPLGMGTQYKIETTSFGMKLTLQMDATLVPAGMPSVPGMEDMMKTQMKTGLDSTMAATKKAIES